MEQRSNYWRRRDGIASDRRNVRLYEDEDARMGGENSDDGKITNRLLEEEEGR